MKKRFLVDEKYIVEVTGLGSSGEGVGKVEGFTIFIEGALPSETVRVQLAIVKKSYAVGKLIEVIHPSVSRVEPKCPVFKQCGGCQLQYLAYDEQLVLKGQQVQEAIARIGGLANVEVLPTLGDENVWYYRNKMMFPVANVRGQVSIGCYARSSHFVVNAAKCFIQHESNNAIMSVVRDWMVKYNVLPFDEKSGTGNIRNVMGRVGVRTGEVMVVLVTKQKEVPHFEQLLELLKEQLGNLVSVVQFVKRENSNAVIAGKEHLLYGRDYITEKIGDFVFNVSAKSFFQVNSVQTEVLYNTAMQFADLTGKETVVEAYCGAGTISLFLAQKAKKVYGIEIVEKAIEDAKKNAQNNNCDNVEFIVGDVVQKLPELIAKDVKADVLVLDPPRAGCDKRVLESILQIMPKKIVYISCNPASLARDLAILHEGGYSVEKVQPVDMFPMTSHVEIVTKLTKK